ncbi:FAD-dependent oxidoreductase [Streptomyces sp. NBC_00083]|uniref:FAD-dependent oxidoreductase n=1 Tax=Streptomyces sp. NBC_00083 TaxID=2975647 RepID=UPI0022598313|nr:FAD-dependent oxidoreductase [Streptomyces sp. NBC_00083]MCX5386978.1 FAD-dependent oxidoreductase [Streptomyces sp. NBC_00083]
MPYVVTRSCCADASCVLACPVNCIHPAPGEPGFGSTEMLYVDPRTCVDCGACTTACPVDALKPHTALGAAELPFLELNAAYYKENAHADRAPMYVVPPQRRVSQGELSVAVVGAGPAGLFAADELLRHPGVRVTVYDRLPTPYGLVRAGVAPDHQDTKRVTELFRAIESQDAFSYRLGVEVGTDITHADLARAHHAVLYAVGAAADRRLGIQGEDLPGSGCATDFVAWYNGHPDRAHDVYDLGCERAVVIGNGNVALDVARILTADPDALARTDISDRALAALRTSEIREVVLLGRRGPAQAAFTVPELLALGALEDVDVCVEGPPELLAPDGTDRTRLLAELAARTPVEGRRRIVLRFLTGPVRITGDACVRALDVTTTMLVTDADGAVRARPTGDIHTLQTGLVLRSVGYRARPVPGLPFDEDTATVPHASGRVEPGVYVAGWIKRGPTGFIGTNKTCAQETVASLLDDFAAGRLTRPGPAAPMAGNALGLEDWRAIDRAERASGEAQGRPRVKFTDRESLHRAAARPGAPVRG